MWTEWFGRGGGGVLLEEKNWIGQLVLELNNKIAHWDAGLITGEKKLKLIF